MQLKSLYGSVTTMTCSLQLDASNNPNGLPSNPNAGREATAVSNASDLAVDVLVQVKTKLQSGALANDQTVFIFGYGLMNGTSEYPDTCTGTDGYVSLNNPTQLVLIGQIPTGAANQAYVSNLFSVAAAFGGCLPSKWSLVIVNSTGVSLTNSSSDHSVTFQEIYYQGV